MRKWTLMCNDIDFSLEVVAGMGVAEPRENAAKPPTLFRFIGLDKPDRAEF